MLTIIGLVGLVIALVGTLIYLKALRQNAVTAPRFTIAQVSPCRDTQPETLRVAVIIPAYNEAENIEACVRSVLESSTWGSDHLQVWVVDDQSTDDTLARVQSLQTTLADGRLAVLAGQPRPVEQAWMGKNWACHQGSQQATGDFLLFIDADVQLHTGAIATAIAHAQLHHIDLMTCVLTPICSCFAEWLVQPLMMGLMAVGLPFAAVNDPQSDAAFGTGQFMLFRRSAYEWVGGHAALAEQVVEDVELARRIKQKGLKLHYALAHDWGTLRMYRTTAALWEGWTKNWYLGSQRNLPITLLGALVVFWLGALPSLALMGWLAKGFMGGFSWQLWAGMAIAFLTILLQYPLRREIQSIAAIPPRYWWLTGLGGIFVSAIILASIIKTETGWGWTWRGRPLQLPNS